jgi:CheY-like chemotaxis protein
VDDDSLVLNNLIAMLEDAGHTVIAASSGEHALAALRREAKFDVMVTDQAMPQMTGLELLELVETDWPDLPIPIRDRLRGIAGWPCNSDSEIIEAFSSTRPANRC